MKNFKKILCISLCTIMLLGVLVACGKTDPEDPAESGNGDPATPGGDVVDTSDTEKVYETDENGFVKDELPDTKYEGKEIKVLGWEENKVLTLPENSGNGNVQLYSKIFYNKLEVEARLDIQLKVNYMHAYGNDPGQTVMNAFMTTVKSGEADYDLIQTFSLYPCMLAQEGLLVNINNLEYPHLDMPWWPSAVQDQWTQYDGLYFLGTNSSATSIRSMFVMFSNTEMITGENLTDPVELVLNGTWTVDKMIEYAKYFHGAAVADPGNAYGLVVDDHSRMDALYYGAGFNFTVNNSDGVAELALADASYRTKLSNYCDKLVTFFKLEETDIAADTRILMKDKKTALMLASMGNVEELQDNSYAPIPIPKYDEESSYRTMQNNGWDMWCIPKTTADAELSGVVIEAIASSEYRVIAPYYFETVLKDRYAQDANGRKVFDIIRSSLIYDLGRVSQFTLTKGTVEGIWRDCFVTWAAGVPTKVPQNTIESAWAKKGENMKADLLVMLANFRNNNRG